MGHLVLDYGTYQVFLQIADGEATAIALTTKEFQTLEYFMKHPNQVVTSQQLMDQLWEVGAEPTSNV
ncbi:winged helix-turn-helix domain-containing protein, partial [Trichocoleus desertorum AS-A10]|uniref:winged helix-turn-helix domain-containing protein n=1 Tax=Trichocoleus desertorum TaxID=1481672 RepID=UPI00329799DB